MVPFFPLKGFELPQTATNVSAPPRPLQIPRLFAHLYSPAWQQPLVLPGNPVALLCPFLPRFSVTLLIRFSSRPAVLPFLGFLRHPDVPVRADRLRQARFLEPPLLGHFLVSPFVIFHSTWYLKSGSTRVFLVCSSLTVRTTALASPACGAFALPRGGKAPTLRPPRQFFFFLPFSSPSQVLKNPLRRRLFPSPFRTRGPSPFFALAGVSAFPHYESSLSGSRPVSAELVSWCFPVLVFFLSDLFCLLSSP